MKALQALLLQEERVELPPGCPPLLPVQEEQPSLPVLPGVEDSPCLGHQVDRVATLAGQDLPGEERTGDKDPPDSADQLGPGIVKISDTTSRPGCSPEYWPQSPVPFLRELHRAGERNLRHVGVGGTPRQLRYPPDLVRRAE